MNVFEILNNVKKYATSEFKIGFVGNGEPFLDWKKLKLYFDYVKDNPNIISYTITNGTVSLPDSEWKYLFDNSITVGFSIDGFKELHDRYRCNSFDKAMSNVETYRRITGNYPTFNATVGKESIQNVEEVIKFFEKFGTRVTFSRMIGRYGITLEEYRSFLDKAEKHLDVRRGGKDCTMYGGICGAGTNNYFFANGQIYYCGNCINLPSLGPSSTPFSELEKIELTFDRNYCYKELLYCE